MSRSGNLSFGKRKKSAGSISGEYGGYSMIFVDLLAFKVKAPIAGRLRKCHSIFVFIVLNVMWNQELPRLF